HINAGHEGHVLFRFGAATRTASGASHGQCSSVWGVSRMMSYRIEERGRAVKTIVSDRKEVGLEGGKGLLLIRDPMSPFRGWCERSGQSDFISLGFPVT